MLVVDDDPGIRETVVAILDMDGYAADVAGDGLAAMERIEQAGPPAAIILDLMMPRMDGFAFAAALERRGLRPGIPLLVLTADGRAGEKAAAVRAEGVLEKPFEIPDLLDHVARLVGA